MEWKLSNRILFIILLLFWLALFALGSFNNSKDIYIRYQESEQFIDCVKHLFLLLLSWTWSNLLILSCIASLVGEYGRIAMTTSRKFNFIAALVRGFFIYLFILAGQLIIAGGIKLPEQYGSEDGSILQAYIRLGFVCSLFGFVVGFRPDYFEGFLEKFIGNNADHAIT